MQRDCGRRIKGITRSRRMPVNSKSGHHHERIRKMKHAGLDRFGRPLPRMIGFNFEERPRGLTGPEPSLYRWGHLD
jgi:hypothetical protein